MQAEKPRVSVIMTNFNGGPYIGTAVRSVLNQTFSDLEMIVVDDASTDNSLEVLSQFQDPRLHVISLEKNVQISLAHNIALEKTSADLIANLDSDDLWAPDKLEKQLSCLETNPSLQAVFTLVNLIDENGADAEEANADLAAIYDSTNLTQDEWVRELFFRGNRLGHSSALFRKNAAGDGTRYDPAYLQLQDFDLWLRIAEKGPIYVLQEKLTSLRRPSRGETSSSRTEEKDSRMLHENALIHHAFLQKMPKKDFLRVFHAHLKVSEASSEEEVACEKAFLLWEYLTRFEVDQVLGLWWFAELLRKEATAKVLQEEYQFSAKDFYQLSSLISPSQGSAAFLKAEADAKNLEKILKETEQQYLETINRLNEAVRVKEESETLRKNTEKEYLQTIARLDEAAEKVISTEQKLKEQHALNTRIIKEYDRAVDFADRYYYADLKLASVQQEAEQTRQTMQSELDHMNQEYASLVAGYNDLADLFHRLEGEHLRVIHTRSWKITRPLRCITKVLRSLKNDGFSATLAKVKRRLAKKKDTIVEKVPEEQAVRELESQPEESFTSLVTVSEEELASQKAYVFSDPPKISLITPLFNTPKEFLCAMIDSVLAQTYQNWELVLVDFSDDTDAKVDEIVREYAESESRILYAGKAENVGIAENTNTCIGYATGSFLAPLDHDDILHPCALFEAARVICDSEADFIYTDEIKFEGTVEHLFAPNLKPDFSAEELRAHNFICHLNVFAKELLEQVGPYDSQMSGSQDHDMVLRLTEKAKKIVHIPQVLYYWRVHTASVALSIDAKPYATLAGERAVTAQLHRMGQEKHAESIINHIPLYRTVADAVPAPVDVTYIVWGGDLPASMRTLGSLMRCHVQGQILLCTVEADESLDSDYLGENVHVVPVKSNRRTSEVWNRLLESEISPYLIWIRAGLEVENTESLKELLAYTDRKDLFCVDAKIVTQDKKWFNSGICVHPDTGRFWARGKGLPDSDFGYENTRMFARETVASLGGLTLMFAEKAKMAGKVHGDETWPLLLYSLEARKKGLKSIWTPFASAIGDEAFLAGIPFENEAVVNMSDPFLSQTAVRMGLDT